MPVVTRRKLLKVCQDAGYHVRDVVQGKHFQVTAEKDGKVGTVTVSVTPKSSFWETWLIADLKRETTRSQ
jgi:hypothetical protein